MFDCRSRSGVDDGVGAAVRFVLGAGGVTNSLRGCGVGDSIVAGFDGSRTILNNKLTTCTKIEEPSPLSLLIWRRLAGSLLAILSDVANCGGR